MGVLMDNSFSPSIHCKEAATKAKRMRFMIRRSFTELSAFAVIYNLLVRPHLEYAMQACSPNLVADADCLSANPAVGDEARQGFPLTAIGGTTTPAGSAPLRERPDNHFQSVFWRIGFGPQPLFIFRQCGLA